MRSRSKAARVPPATLPADAVQGWPSGTVGGGIRGAGVAVAASAAREWGQNRVEFGGGLRRLLAQVGCLFTEAVGCSLQDVLRLIGPPSRGHAATHLNQRERMALMSTYAAPGEIRALADRGYWALMANNDHPRLQISGYGVRPIRSESSSRRVVKVCVRPRTLKQLFHGGHA